jgi:hypothetical protein
MRFWLSGRRILWRAARVSIEGEDFRRKDKGRQPVSAKARNLSTSLRATRGSARSVFPQTGKRASPNLEQRCLSRFSLSS